MRYRNNLVRLFLLTLFALVIRTNTATAQNPFAFTPNGLSGWSDTVYAWDSLLVAGYLKNYDTANVFTDSLEIRGYVDTGQVVPFTIPVLTQWFLQPMDSSWLIFPVIFTPGSSGGMFHVGNNVVVVWPYAINGSFNAIDSVHLNVFLIDTVNSVGPEYPPGNIRIYPVPSNGPLYISSYHPQYQVSLIIIRDGMGQEVYRSESNSGPINTESWAPGMYTVETTLSNGSISVYKILRQ